MADDGPFGILPVVDVAPLLSSQAAGSTEVARQIEAMLHGVALSPSLDTGYFAAGAGSPSRSSSTPDLTAEIPPLPGRAAVSEGGQPHWDGQYLHGFSGTYGDYTRGKV